MNLQKDDLTNEGSISFIIRLKENPPFRDPNSNITFMLDKDIGGVNITILKEKEDIRVEVDNRQYGKTRIIHNISDYLNNDMMIALTWKEDVIKLYLNGELADEDILEKGKGMIDVVIGPEANQLLEGTDISKDEIYDTINDRHRGLLIAGNPLRIGAIHWFDRKIVFLIASVSKSRTIKNILKFEQVTANLILRLKSELPAGIISRDMDFVAILTIVAESFGVPVITTKGGQPKLLHIAGDWDGTLSFKAGKGETVLLQGTFNPNENKCYYVWAFSLEKYKNWLQGVDIDR